MPRSACADQRISLRNHLAASDSTDFTKIEIIFHD